MVVSTNAWLNSNRDYWSGVEIFNSVSNNTYLKELFSKGPNAYTVNKLASELIAVSKEVSAVAIQQYQDLERKVFIPEYEDFVRKGEIKLNQIQRANLPEDLQIKFDEKSHLTHFINSLRLKLHDSTFHEREKIIPKIMDADERRRVIHREIDHFLNFGERIEERPANRIQVDIDKLSEVDAESLLKKVLPQVSKLKKKPLRKEDYEYYLDLKSRLYEKLGKSTYGII